MRAIVVSVLIIIASLAIATVVLVRLPADYLRRDGVAAAPIDSRDPYVLLRTVTRNALGVLLIAIGIFLAIPGVPGQGLLVALAGLLLVDFPAKRRVLARLVAWPRLLPVVNRLRARFAQPPLKTDRDPGAASPRSGA